MVSQGTKLFIPADKENMTNSASSQEIVARLGLVNKGIFNKKTPPKPSEFKVFPSWNQVPSMEKPGNHPGFVKQNPRLLAGNSNTLDVSNLSLSLCVYNSMGHLIPKGLLEFYNASSPDPLIFMPM